MKFFLNFCCQLVKWVRKNDALFQSKNNQGYDIKYKFYYDILIILMIFQQFSQNEKFETFSTFIIYVSDVRDYFTHYIQNELLQRFDIFTAIAATWHSDTFSTTIHSFFDDNNASNVIFILHLIVQSICLEHVRILHFVT